MSSTPLVEVNDAIAAAQVERFNLQGIAVYRTLPVRSRLSRSTA